VSVGQRRGRAVAESTHVVVSIRKLAWYVRLGAARLRRDPLSFPGALWRAAALPLRARGADAPKCECLPRASAPLVVPGRVSVVLPVFNHAELLGEAIRSVRAQTWPDFELIVVDDGSEDDIDAVLAALPRDPRVHVLRQPNRGLPAALTAGFRFATGELLTWTSADNVLEPDMLAQLAGFLRQHPEVAMVYADYTAIDAEGNPLRGSDFFPQFRASARSPVVRLPRDPAAISVRAPNFLGPCFLYRELARRCLPEWSGAPLVEDWDYWMRLSAGFRVAHLGTDATPYRYRWHAQSLNARHRGARLLARGRELLAREARRAAYRQEPWGVLLDASLAAPGAWEAPATPYAVSAWEGAHGAAEQKRLAVLAAEALTAEALAPGERHFTAVLWPADPARALAVGFALDHPRVLHLVRAGDDATAAMLDLFTTRVVAFATPLPGELLPFLCAWADAATAEPAPQTPLPLPEPWHVPWRRPRVHVTHAPAAAARAREIGAALEWRGVACAVAPATARVPDADYDAVCAVGTPVRAARPTQAAVVVAAPGAGADGSCAHGALVFASPEDLRRASPALACLPRALVLRPGAHEAIAVARLLLWLCRGGSIAGARAWFRDAAPVERPR
jgi:hypothetical protein